MSLEPKKSRVWTVEEYWSCAFPSHRHRTYEVAKRCLDTKRPRAAISD